MTVPPGRVGPNVRRTGPRGTVEGKHVRRSVGGSGVQFLGSLVASEDEALVLGWVFVPELCGLAVQRA